MARKGDRLAVPAMAWLTVLAAIRPENVSPAIRSLARPGYRFGIGDGLQLFELRPRWRRQSSRSAGLPCGV